MSETTFGNYVLGLAGLSLLRRWYSEEIGWQRERLVQLAGEYRESDLLQLALQTPEYEAAEGYSLWAESYDGPGNPMVESEEAVVTPRLAELFRDGMVALDAGCGTGRHSHALAGLGYQVIGTDLTPAMLEVARTKAPEVDFRQGPFEDLPLDDDSVDLVTSALAVCHAVDLDPVFAEFARVLKPGGRVIVSDPHPSLAQLGGQAFFRHDGGMPFVRNRAHLMSEYTDAMLASGFRIDGLTELRNTQDVIDLNPAAAVYPDLVREALIDLPYVVIFEASLGDQNT